MRLMVSLIAALSLAWAMARADEPRKPAALVIKPDAFSTLVNPSCSHCRDEAKRRAGELRPGDRILCWIRGYSEGGAIPIRFFLAPYRVISDSYGVFVYDPDAGFARGFAPSYDFRFHGWRNGVMVLRHQDGTLYSALTGLAFEGPKKGTRLQATPSLVSDWGHWLEHYPNAVAYHMFDKYKPTELPVTEAADSVRSRVKPDQRLEPQTAILGVWTGKTARAYPISALATNGLLTDPVDGETLLVLWEPATHSAAAYRPVAVQPRKFKAPAPDAHGISKLDEGVLVPEGTPALPPRRLSLHPASTAGAGRFQDEQTGSFWDVAGRCVEGTLKGWTLEWVDSVQVKWFAWAAEYPDTTIYGRNQ
jgi:intein/homing endonuclease